jgi:hypothetical protein
VKRVHPPPHARRGEVLYVHGNRQRRLGVAVVQVDSFESKTLKPVFHFVGSRRVETRGFQAVGHNWIELVHSPASARSATAFRLFFRNGHPPPFAAARASPSSAVLFFVFFFPPLPLPFAPGLPSSI